MMGCLSRALLLTAVVVTTSAAQAAAPKTACDTLAAHPADPQKVGAGVAEAKLNPASAIPACQQAVAEAPDEARFKSQLGRALWKIKRYKEGLPYIQEAALAGSPSAQAYLGDAFAGMHGLYDQDLEQSGEYYAAAVEGGFRPAAGPLAQITAALGQQGHSPQAAAPSQKPLAIDFSKYNQPTIFGGIYNGDFNTVGPIQGAGQFAIDVYNMMKQSCPLLFPASLTTELGNKVVGDGQKRLKSMTQNDWANALRNMTDVNQAMANANRSAGHDEAVRQDSIRFLQVYGCESPPTERFAANLGQFMLDKEPRFAQASTPSQSGNAPSATATSVATGASGSRRLNRLLAACNNSLDASLSMPLPSANLADACQCSAKVIDNSSLSEAEREQLIVKTKGKEYLKFDDVFHGKRGDPVSDTLFNCIQTLPISRDALTDPGNKPTAFRSTSGSKLTFSSQPFELAGMEIVSFEINRQNSPQVLNCLYNRTNCGTCTIKTTERYWYGDRDPAGYEGAGSADFPVHPARMSCPGRMSDTAIAVYQEEEQQRKARADAANAAAAQSRTSTYNNGRSQPSASYAPPPARAASTPQELADARARAAREAQTRRTIEGAATRALDRLFGR